MALHTKATMMIVTHVHTMSIITAAIISKSARRSQLNHYQVKSEKKNYTGLGHKNKMQEKVAHFKN